VSFLVLACIGLLAVCIATVSGFVIERTLRRLYSSRRGGLIPDLKLPDLKFEITGPPIPPGLRHAIELEAVKRHPFLADYALTGVLIPTHQPAGSEVLVAGFRGPSRTAVELHLPLRELDVVA